jgi:hypothetical protein
MEAVACTTHMFVLGTASEARYLEVCCETAWKQEMVLIVRFFVLQAHAGEAAAGTRAVAT